MMVTGPGVDTFDRAHGALLGVALGDALGMPSQTLTPGQIAASYGRISGFVAPVADHPVSHGLPAGAVTDDTEQTILLAEQILASPGQFDEDAWARALLSWEKGVKQRGLRDLLGPSTKRAVTDLLSGTPASETGKSGNTNGAAMRIAPVGISTPVRELSKFVDQIEITCRLTHNTAEAIAAAAAVAAVVSAGVDGASFEDAVPVALAAAREGAARGYLPNNIDFAETLQKALNIGNLMPPDMAVGELESSIGAAVVAHQSVATAFGIVRIAKGDPWQAAVLSANIGDDTDTIGAISAGMAAACCGASALPRDKVAQLTKVNNLDFAPLVKGLLQIRTGKLARSTLLERAQ